MADLVWQLILLQLLMLFLYIIFYKYEIDTISCGGADSILCDGDDDESI